MKKFIMLGLGVWAVCAQLVGAKAQMRKHAPIVAVFKMEGRGGTPLTKEELSGLTDYLGTLLGEGGVFQIIPRQEIRARLTQQKKESFRECVDKTCQIEIGRELAAQFTVTSTISKVGKQCLITAALYDLRKAATARTVSGRAPCEPDKLITEVEKIAARFEAAMGGSPRRQTQATRQTTKQPQAVKQPEPVTQPNQATTVAQNQPSLKVLDEQPAEQTQTSAHQNTAQTKRVPKFYGEFGFMGNNISNIANDYDWEIDDQQSYGLDLGLDWRMGRAFMMGFNLTYGSLDTDFEEVDINLTTLGMRIGGLIVFNDRFQLYPYSRFGFLILSYDSSYGDTRDSEYGLFVGGGARFHVMIISVLGAYADLSLEIQEIFESDAEYPEDTSSLTNLAINFGFGIMAAF